MRMQTAQAIRWSLPLKWAVITTTVILFTLVGAVNAPAGIINVPGDQPTIQDGINAAMLVFDTVLVAPGTYFENLRLRPSVTLTSHYMLDEDPAHIINTVIDGSNPNNPDSASCMIIQNCTNVVVQGFTITNGSGTKWFDEHGAGIFREGGGILIQACSPVIRYNRIVYNQATDESGGMASSGGGGMRVGDGEPEIYNNVITHNQGGGYGGGIVFNYSGGTVRNNIIAHNSGGAAFGGGGVWRTGGGNNTLVENNTIVFNHSGFNGGGVWCQYGGHVDLKNNIIWGNTATVNAQIHSASTVTTTYCAVQGGFSGEGNIDLDPQMIDAYFYLKATSPCIDAGNPATESNDVENLSKAGDALWPARGGLRNDMGAYGGPGGHSFELVALLSDTTLGWVPFAINFEAYTSLSVDTWIWDFGDGESASVQHPTHVFQQRGLYDVSLQIDVGGEIYEILKPEMVAAVADTMYADSVTVGVEPEVEVLIYASNTISLEEINIPVEFAGDLVLDLDSFSTAGCRTDYFEEQAQVHFSPTNKRFTVNLRSSLSGTSPDLQPGSGPVLKLYFTRISGSEGDAASISLDGYTSGGTDRLPEYTGKMGVYAPVTNDGDILYANCCADFRGNVDGDPDDQITIADLVYLVDFMFNGGLEPTCWKEANINGDLVGDILQQVDVADLVHLVDYMFTGGAAPPTCFL